MSRVSKLSQMFPPAPAWTDQDISDLSGKVYIVTGSNAGVGKEVARILYSKNATVWAAARNEEKNLAAISSIKEAYPSSTGKLEHLHLDLGDLSTIKKSAETFLAKEKKLHVLINNAGVMLPPRGSTTAQGYELQLGTNCVGPFLFTKLLTPALVETAKTAPKNAVRVVWVSSSAAEGLSYTNGLDIDNLDYSKNDGIYMQIAGKYAVSKSGNWYHSTEFARRHRKDGVISVALNPGNLDSDLSRHHSTTAAIFKPLICYAPVYGAYTELFAGVSDQVTLDKTGSWIVPWGRFSDMRSDLDLGSRPEGEGGTGIAQKFWEWSEAQVQPYL
ncbi:hypothetical protein JX265_001890 [Neoarthrinium moseri]|uniref:Short-chain dehydrogenase n=1 Tax=Neoarthrinium moseri TaxID=1658444 RepID=A0A9P9WW02_9PEZI|nr:hypothetical protein JX265_001890 [Neoarthrinium moseri]